MTASIRHAGVIPADSAQGLHGGTCSLVLANGVFVLRLVRHYLYGIEVTDTVRGAQRATEGGIALSARTWHQRKVETTAVETDARLEADWRARHVDAPGPPGAVLDLAVTLAAESFAVLLVREAAADAAPDLALAAWLVQARAQREAAREREARARLHSQRSAESSTAFAAKDHARVVALLEPLEGELSPAERQRLAMARRHLSGPTA